MIMKLCDSDVGMMRRTVDQEMMDILMKSQVDNSQIAKLEIGIFINEEHDLMETTTVQRLKAAVWKYQNSISVGNVL